MRKLDKRGVAALEFCLVGGALFLLMFLIFDLGLYAIHVQSLRTLANTEARANMISCYTPAAIAKTSPSSCTGEASCCPFPLCRRSHAYTEHGCGSHCTDCYGI